MKNSGNVVTSAKNRALKESRTNSAFKIYVKNIEKNDIKSLFLPHSPAGLYNEKWPESNRIASLLYRYHQNTNTPLGTFFRPIKSTG
jgi:hypothetical protein